MRRLRDKEELDGRDRRRRQHPGREPLCRPPRRLPLHARHERRRHSRPRRAPRRGQGAGARACRPRCRARRGAATTPSRSSPTAASPGASRRSPGSSAATAPLKPKIQLLADEHLGAADREQVLRRLEAWLDAELDAASSSRSSRLSEASDLSGLARGLAFRLAGDSRRASPRGGRRARSRRSTKAPRAQLRKYGVRFGAFNVYIPALLKPAAADLVLLLWALHAGRELRPRRRCPAAPPAARASPRSRPMRTSPSPIGTRPASMSRARRAVRIDMLERLSDLIRARVSWRPAEGGAAAPSGATGDGGFRVVPELMCVVGCSGEDFASILKALGFRRERRKLAPTGRRRSRRRKRPMARRPCDANRGAGASEPPSTRSGGQASARMRAERHDTHGEAQAAAAARTASAGACQREPRPRRRARSASAPPNFRLSPCLRSFAAISPPAGRKETEASHDVGSAARQMALVREARQDAHRSPHELIEAGKIRINGERAEIEPPGALGDVVTGISAGAGRLFVVRVAGEAERRGPATIARTLYEDLTPAAPAPASNVARRYRASVPPSATAGGSTPSRPTMHSCDCVLRCRRSL